MKTLRRSLLTLSLAAVSFGGFSCGQGAMSDADTVVGQASSALTVADESGDVTADGVAAEGDAALAVSADESAAVPEAAPDADGVCDLEGRRQRILARYDANANGQLDRDELAALRSDLADKGGFAARFGVLHRRHVLRRLAWVFDENDDGQLSADERTALIDALHARCERIKANVLAHFDANGDGQLDETERAAAKAALVARVQAQRERILSQYDVNHDGVLDDGERAQLRADRVAAFKARRAELVAQFDADHDGTLNAAEKLALRQAIQQRIIDGRDSE
ncbi:MAG: calcium-binding protein [Myxococcaceae bacterium]